MTEYLAGFCYGFFLLSLVVGVAYDVWKKKPPTHRKTSAELFVAFVLEQALHFAMLILLIAAAKRIETFARLLNGEEWVLFPKNQRSISASANSSGFSI